MTSIREHQARSETFKRSQRSGLERSDRSQATLPGPQYLVRARSMRPVTGRPDPIEQAAIAAGAGALLRQLRADRQMSLRDLEARSGVNRSTITRLERGLRRPRRSLLGWLCWGLDAENVVPLTAQLAAAAGDSLIAESRWSERTHARHAADALMRGGLPVPFILLAPYAPSAFGWMYPGDPDRLRQLQAAQAAGLPWPPGMAGSPEALAVANALMGLSHAKLAEIGRAAVRVNDYPAMRERRRRKRARRAEERESFTRTRLSRRRLPAGFGVM